MKPTAQLIAGMFVIASLSASCDSCNKKHDGESMDQTTTTSATETTTDTTITADATEPAVSNETQQTSASKNAVGKSSRSSGKSDASKDGYSAADGTDAENHDGDQYTRNDQKPMPSGPPMK